MVGQTDGSRGDVVVAHDNNSLAGFFQGVRRRMKLRRFPTQVLGHTAYGNAPALDPTRYAHAGNLLDVAGFWQREVSCDGLVDDRRGQRCAAASCSTAAVAARISLAEWPSKGTTSVTCARPGKRSRLVERDSLNPPQVFQVSAALDEDAAAGGAGDPAENRGRGSNRQGAGGCGREKRHGPVEHSLQAPPPSVVGSMIRQAVEMKPWVRTNSRRDR